MKTAYRIKERRKQLGLTATQLAEKLGVHHSTIYRYENGDIEKVPTAILSDIAKTLDTTPAFLMGWEDTQQKNVSSIFDDKILNLGRELQSSRRSKWIDYGERLLEEQNNSTLDEPITYYTYNYYDQPASAGTGQYLNDVQVETIDLPVDINADFVVPIYGDSMEPDYSSGDYIFVKLSVNLSDGDIGVFEYYGDAYIKQLVINDYGAFLHSLNKNYDDIPIDTDSDFRIIGEVVGSYTSR
ncbi:phage transcriptional repressor [Streptococcus equi subsp. equi]|uniref:XRE family transcriptional regulator n=1 Tax=Streptococcus equi TaxID=1336 RepID=UPI00065941AD|nr:phage transcriptional repressor [Streptococcus equi subsp. equi]